MLNFIERLFIDIPDFIEKILIIIYIIILIIILLWKRYFK